MIHPHQRRKTEGSAHRDCYASLLLSLQVSAMASRFWSNLNRTTRCRRLCCSISFEIYGSADFSSGWIRLLNPSNNAATGFATGIANPVNLQVAADGSLNEATLTVTAAPPARMLLTEENTERAIALDSVTLMRDPFPLVMMFNFSSKQCTWVTLFAIKVELMPGENSSMYKLSCL